MPPEPQTPSAPEKLTLESQTPEPVQPAPVTPQPMQSFASTPPVSTPMATAPSQIVYGGFFLRAAANFFDTILVVIIGFALRLIFGDSGFASFVSFIASYVYYILMLTYKQATLGKMAVGIHIERSDGSSVSFGVAFKRELSKILSSLILGIGFLMVIWTKKKQGLHDKIADTVVIENDPNVSKTGWKIFGGVIGLGLPILAGVGIFAAVVLSSLSAARLKGAESSINSGMSSVQAKAELYYERNNSYMGYCDTPDAVAALQEVSSIATNNEEPNFYICNDSISAYAASAPIKEGGYSCVDSTGVTPATKFDNLLPSGQTFCGEPGA